MRREELRVLLIVCLGTFFHIQSVGSISISLSAIQKEFGTSLAAVQWIGLMGAIMLSSLSLCFGRAGDLIGRKSIFKMGLTLYTAGAGLAAISDSFPQLLAFRFTMALGLAMAAPLSAAIIASVHGSESRGQALGWLAASIALGRTTGPTIGGFILHLWGWRAVFFANCIFGIATCLILFLILKGKEERRKGSFDFLGVFSLVIGFPSLLIALSLGPRLGWNASEIMLWLGLAAAGMVSFSWTEAMIAADSGAAMAKPSAMVNRNASNCGNEPETAARPAPAVYRVSPILKIDFRPVWPWQHFPCAPPCSPQ